MEILLTEPAVRSSAGQRALPNIKNILLHIQNDAGFQNRLQMSLSVARATGAHLQCVQVTPIEAYVMMGSLGGLFAIDRWIKKIDAQEAQFRSRVEAHLKLEDVSWDYEQITSYATTEMIRHAAFADLVVASRHAHAAEIQRPETAALGEILTQVRTPLLIPGNAPRDFDPFGVAVIAWNGSFEAANAVRSAIGLLGLASEVRVIRYSEDQDSPFADTKLTEYLSRHGIHAELDVRSVRLDFADDLVQYATLYHGSYIVMGGYSHSRASELIFGGVTRALLRDCPVPLFVSH